MLTGQQGRSSLTCRPSRSSIHARQKLKRQLVSTPLPKRLRVCTNSEPPQSSSCKMSDRRLRMTKEDPPSQDRSCRQKARGVSCRGHETRLTFSLALRPRVLTCAMRITCLVQLHLLLPLAGNQIYRYIRQTSGALLSSPFGLFLQFRDPTIEGILLDRRTDQTKDGGVYPTPPQPMLRVKLHLKHM